MVMLTGCIVLLPGRILAGQVDAIPECVGVKLLVVIATGAFEKRHTALVGCLLSAHLVNTLPHI